MTRWIARSPSVLIVTYASGRTERHAYSSYTDALKAQETFQKLPTVTITQIERGKA